MIKNLIVLSGGTEISSGSGTENAIQSSTVKECVNSETELALGSVCASMMDMKLITPGGELDISAGDELTLYRVEDNARQKIGLFTAEKPTRASANSCKLTAYDRITRLDRDLTSWLASLEEWPYSLGTLASMVCSECGLTLTTTSFPNSDYQVQQFYGDGVTGRRIMEWIGQIAARFVRAADDGSIELAWYGGTTHELQPSGERYYFQSSLSYEDYQVAAIEAVQLKTTDADVGISYPEAAEGANVYAITGNFLLDSSDTETLTTVAQNIYNEVRDVTYTPGKVSVLASYGIRAGDIVRVTDRNGKTITMYAMTVTVKGQRADIECTGSARRDSPTATNNETLKSLRGKLLEIKKTADGLVITAQKLVEKDGELEESIAQIQMDAEEILAQVENTEGELARLQLRADEIESRVQDAEGNIGALEVRADEIEGKVEDNEGNIANLQIQADEIVQRVEDAEGNVSEAVRKADEAASTVKDISGEWTEVKQNAGQVSVTSTDEDGNTLGTYIRPGIWESKYTKADGTVTSSLYFDFVERHFVFDGTGRWRSPDGKSYVEVDNDEIVFYGVADDGTVLDVIRIGSIPGKSWPHIILGNAGEGGESIVGMIKKYWDGLWIGNSAPRDDNQPYFEAKDGYGGIFVDTLKGEVYVVKDTSAKNIWTGNVTAKFA